MEESVPVRRAINVGTRRLRYDDASSQFNFALSGSKYIRENSLAGLVSYKVPTRHSPAQKRVCHLIPSILRCVIDPDG